MREYKYGIFIKPNWCEEMGIELLSSDSAYINIPIKGKTQDEDSAVELEHKEYAVSFDPLETSIKTLEDWFDFVECLEKKVFLSWCSGEHGDMAEEFVFDDKLKPLILKKLTGGEKAAIDSAIKNIVDLAKEENKKVYFVRRIPIEFHIISGNLVYDWDKQVDRLKTPEELKYTHSFYGRFSAGVV